MGADGARGNRAKFTGRGRTPILVGGTGLYLRTLLEGIAPVPAIDPEVRAPCTRDAPSRKIASSLQKLDLSRAARLKPADTARINRALEVILSTGRTLGEWQKRARGRDRRTRSSFGRSFSFLRANGSTRAATSVSRIWSIGRRQRGRGLADAQTQSQPSGHAGDRGARTFGLSSWGKLRSTRRSRAGQQATRRYAKRQYTWFAHQPPADWPRFKERARPRPPRRSAGSRSSRRARRPGMELLLDADIDPAPLAGKRVAILGYGNQGRAQALNLKDSGIDVVVGLRGGSGSTIEAEAAGLRTALVEDAVSVCRSRDDARARRNPRRALPRDRAELRKGAALGFSHGLSVRFGFVEPRADLDVFLIAPKGPGTALRSLYTEGKGMIAVWAVAQDATGEAREHCPRLRPCNRLRPRRPDRFELRRGGRSRPVQRAGGGLGRGSRAADRRVRDVGCRRRFARARLSRMRRRAEAASPS